MSLLEKIPYGMYIVTSKLSNADVGCTINTFSQITASTKMISVNINKENVTAKAIEENKKFAICILSENVNPQVIGKFGFFHSDKINKFADFQTENISGLNVVTEGVVGVLICELKSVIDVDTHNVYIAQVVEEKSLDCDANVMTYDYYKNVIKGKASKNAPTYIEQIK